MGVIMLGDLKVVHTKQVFRFNRVRNNEVPLYRKCGGKTEAYREPDIQTHTHTHTHTLTTKHPIP